MHIFKLFIYGTLKSDGPAHHLLRKVITSASKAEINGKLYIRQDDAIPYITVPGKFIQARGSHDYTRDAAMISKSAVPEGYAFQNAADVVHGELYEILDYKHAMSVVDLFEDYSPGYESEYDRVLYPVRREGTDTFELAWVYTIAGNHAEVEDERVADGVYVQRSEPETTDSEELD